MSLYSSGSEFEKTIFGECKWKKSISNYIPKRECVKKIIEKGESDEPTIKFIIKKASSRLKKPVRAYSALGSPLDWWHGIDGFFICSNHIITADATLNKNKVEKKADIMIRMIDIENPYKLINAIVEIFSFKLKVARKKKNRSGNKV